MSATGASGSEGGVGGRAGAVHSISTEEERSARQREPGPWWWPRRRSVVLDVFLALMSAVECAVEGAAFAKQVGVPVGFFVLLGLAAGSALVLRRRWPVAVVLVALAVAPAQMGIILVTVGLYTLAAAPLPRRITFSLAGLLTVGTFVVTALNMHRDQQGRDGVHMPMAALVLTSLLVAIGVTVAPLLLGLYIGARRRLVESLVDRADGLERELALLAEKASERAQRARIEERTRIAREMHDVVAHRVSLMVVHAGALQSLAVRDPEKAARNAELLGDMGRQALDELRQMLGVLRANETPPAESPRAAALTAVALASVPLPLSTEEQAVRARREVGDAVAEERGAAVDLTRKGPALEDVEKLVGESRAAGMAVELSVEGEERPLAAEAEITAYRVVQEALTNVHKHAPGAKTTVRVAYRADEVAVLVENGPSDGTPSAALPSGGNGLVGMRERVKALGGGFVAGPRDNGGFRVSAMLPDRS